MDKLEHLFELQKTLQERLGTDVKTQEFRNIMALAAFVELGEMMQETPFKPWKKNASLKLNEARVELIDLQHFVINLALSLGMTADDFYNIYLIKNGVNHARQDKGY